MPQDPNASDAAQESSAPVKPKLQEVAAVFLNLGLTAFGGPAAHIALMETEVVGRRQWVSRSQFLDLVGLTGLIPGPNSTELVIHLGYARAGWPGLWVAGICFIVPAMLLVWGCAIAYVQFQTLPAVGQVLYGIKPVVLAILVQALLKLGRTALKDKSLIALSLIVVGLNSLGLSELLLLVLAGTANLVRHWPSQRTLSLWVPLLPFGIAAPAWGSTQVFLYFLKIGSILYGSGYVLLAFLQQDLVERSHLLSSQQLLDAIAIGQITPGPVFTTATFIGYLLAGHAGAFWGTVGIFLPAFLFVGLTALGLEKLRHSARFRAFLDGVNGATVGLIGVVAFKLGTAAVLDSISGAIALLSIAILLKFPQLNSIVLILAGALGGVLAQKM
jgi:chromate transporter